MIIDNPLYKQDLEEIVKYVSLKEDAAILVTGGTGLIGSLIVDALVSFNRMNTGRKIDVYAMSRNLDKIKERFSYVNDNDGVHFIAQDITEPLSDEVKYDYIIHAASNADPRTYALYPVETIKTNVMGTVNVLEYAKKHINTRVVFTSTMEVYGELYTDDSEYKKKENDYGRIDFNSIRSGYPESKRTSELLCRSYCEEYGVQAMIARLGYIYGPSMTKDDSKVVAQFIRNILMKQDIVLKSKGEQRRSYCYNVDAVTGIFAVLFGGKAGEAYNVANDASIISIAKMAELAAGIAGSKVIYDLPDEIEAKGFSKPQSVVLDTQKLTGLNWKALYDMEAGLRRTVDILSTEQN